MLGESKWDDHDESRAAPRGHHDGPIDPAPV